MALHNLAATDLGDATRGIILTVRDQIAAPETQTFFGAIFDFLRNGFAQVNVAEGLIIALIAALFMPSWRRWFPMAFIATFATLALNVVIPVLSGNADLHLPAVMDPAFWQFLASLFVGYLVAIGVFFAAKRMFTGAEAQPAHG